MQNCNIAKSNIRSCSLVITVKIATTCHYKRSIVVLQRCHGLMLQSVFSWYKVTWWFSTNPSKSHIIIISFVFSEQIKHEKTIPAKVFAYFSALTESSRFPPIAHVAFYVKFLFSLLFFEEGGDVAMHQIRGKRLRARHGVPQGQLNPEKIRK